MSLTSRDHILYLAKVAKWLEDCPDGDLGYGEFYVSKVEVSFSGDVLGTFVSDDPDWLYEDKQT